MATVINSAPASTKKYNPRGSSFTPVEDEAIARARVVASEDPIVGTEQRGNDFFSKIQKVYNEKFKLPNREDRSMMSIKTRCKAIHKECMNFSGCHARIARAHPTGVSPTDIINMATAIYNGVEIENVEDDCGKPFKYLRAWNTLRRHQKFLGGGEKLKSPNSAEAKGSTDESDEQSGATHSTNANDKSSDGFVPPQEWPMGRKRAKEQKKSQEETAKKLRLAAQSVAAQQERNESLRRLYEILLFTNAPACCDNSEAVEYFKIMRNRALLQLRPEEGLEKDGSPTTRNYDPTSHDK